MRPVVRGMRICLIGDTHGFVPGLEAAIEACRRHAPDRIVHCGDFLTAPFSPDPPGETMDLLRAEGVDVVYGNNEAYLRDWGTPRWESTVAARRRRPDSPDYFLSQIERGQAEIGATDLAWLRSLPTELSLDGARAGDLFVCHGMPGNPFATIWDTDPAFTPDSPITKSTRRFPAMMSRRPTSSCAATLRAQRSCESRFQMAGRRSWFAAPGTGPATDRVRGTRGFACSPMAAARCPDSPAGGLRSSGRHSSRATRAGPT